MFTNAYTSITKSDPAIASIMTGQYPVSLRIVNNGNDVTEKENLTFATFLAEILRKNGFKTAAVDWLSRWHKRGFDYYSGVIIEDLGFRSGVIHRSWKSYYMSFFLLLIDTFFYRTTGRDLGQRLYRLLFPLMHPGYDTADVVVDRAIAILRKMRKKKLFLYVHLWDAHKPYVRNASFFAPLERVYES